MDRSPHSENRILVIGVGNEFRGDDSVGLVLARRIRDLDLPGVAVLENGGDGAALLESWDMGKPVILIDAAKSGADAGTLHRIEAHLSPIPNPVFLSSSHLLGVVEAVELARSMNRLPPVLLVYGIEGKNFEFGGELSSEVKGALHSVTDRLVREIREIVGEESRDVSATGFIRADADSRSR